MTETPDARLKRLKMRSMRRGMREMDLILGAFADRRLDTLAPEALDRFDALLSESDQDLYDWIAGREPPPEHYDALIAVIAEETEGLVRP